ncbi:FAD-dependent oxidoreductase [Haloarcula sp. S1AR25-5A]|uniref:FAD-dependent oxidoreductase n=1 Tax=Haloarcula terrestris TaxID=2950533 RepID=A0AAE4F306_9EURY|nr:FAD-dependent oxidoreductase [Haloarcula terrestris]MDS0223366.1 FAD-dependent oxidoreductase [Haloarcula terrestris]
MSHEFTHLFQPGRIGSTNIRNRLVMAPMGTNFASERGEVTDQLVEYYAERANGGTGLIILEVTAVDHPVSDTIANQLRIDDDSCIPGLARLTTRLHNHDAKVFVQLHHAGGQTTESKTGGIRPVVPSQAEQSYSAQNPRVLETEEVEDLVGAFVGGAKRARKAGFDGVELHGAHGYLLEQFMSSRTNSREDKYGGSLRGRMQFPLEIVEGIRDELSTDINLSFRMSADEFVEDGYGVKQSKQMAELLEEAGVDILHVSAGTYGSAPQTLEPMRFEEGWRSYLAAEIGSVVDIPTIAVGVVRQPETADKIIAEGKATFVAIGRGHISDPYFARKAKEGRLEELNRCIGCNIGCIGEGFMADKQMGCTINPAVGREREFAIRESAATPKDIIVVGAGPAGVQAAIRATDRGHDVMLYDAAERIGGQLHIAAQPPGKEKIQWYLEYLKEQLSHRAVECRLGERVDAELIRDSEPDTIVVATGARPRELDIPGVDQSHVVQAWDILRESVPVAGETAVIIGGGDVGCDVATYLAAQGTAVTIVEQTDRIAPDKERISRIDMLQQFDKNRRIDTKTGETVVSIEESAVVTTTESGIESTYETDTVVVAAGHESNNDLAMELEADPVEVYIVGDARESRNILRATHEGTEAGISIGSAYPMYSPRF